MAAMTFTVEVPDSVKLDRKALQEQLTAFAKILISYAPKVKKKEKEDSSDHAGGETMSESNLAPEDQKDVIFDSEGVIQDASVVDSTK